MRAVRSVRWMVLSLGCLGMLVPGIRAGDDEADLIKSIQDRGGMVIRDEEAKDKPVVEIVLNSERFGDKDLARVKRFLSLRKLDLARAQVTDDGLENLAGLESLGVLDSRATRVTAAGLKHIAALKSLHTLHYNGEQITDESLRELFRLGLAHKLIGACGPKGDRPTSAADVTGLQFWGVSLTDAGLKDLAGFKNLERLDLTSGKWTPAGLEALTALKSLARLNLHPVTDEVLRKLRDFNLLHTLIWARSAPDGTPASAAEVRFFNFCYPGATAEGLKELAAFPNLERLELYHTRLADSGLKGVAGLKSLRTLLTNSKVTDGALKELAGLESLRTLALRGSKVTDAGMKDLARVRSLEDLDLEDSDVTDAGLREIARLPSLHTLNLQGTKVTPVGLKALAGLKLRRLELSAAQVTDTMLRALREANLLHALSRAVGKRNKRPTTAAEIIDIDLEDTPITDAGLRVLAHLKSLKGISLSGTKVTDKGIAELKKAIPGLEVAR